MPVDFSQISHILAPHPICRVKKGSKSIAGFDYSKEGANFLTIPGTHTQEFKFMIIKIIEYDVSSK